MNTLGDVRLEVRSLLGDPDGDWVTDGYVTPIINTTYRLQTLAIKNATGKNLENIVIVQNVEAGTTSLYPQQAKGQPLEGLYNPLFVSVKVAGAPPNYFWPAKYCGGLPRVAPPGPVPSLNGIDVWWTFIGNKLLITPVNGAIDIEVHGRYNPPALAKPEDILVVSPDMESVTATGSAAVAGVERTNPQMLEGYAQMALAGLDNIIADLTRQKQGALVRPARMDRNSAGWYGWGWRS